MHPEAVTQSYPLYALDILETQPQSGARISIGHARLVLGPNSRLTFYEPASDGHAIIGLERGTLRMELEEDRESMRSLEILAGESSTSTYHGEVTVWVREDIDDLDMFGPRMATIHSVGVINHGAHGEATFGAMGRSIVIRPGYLSVTAPHHPPVPAVAVEVAKPFVTTVVESTNLGASANSSTEMALQSRPPVKRLTETVAQRACKSQKEQARRIKPTADQNKTRLTHCL